MMIFGSPWKPNLLGYYAGQFHITRLVAPVLI